MKNPVLQLMANALPHLLLTQGKQRLSILIFHRVLAQRDFMRPNEPTTGEFEWMMRMLRDNFNPLSLVDALEKLQSGTLPGKAVCVTFDDGYADNQQYALPLLEKYGIPATVFVSTGFLNGGRMWNDSVIEAVRHWNGAVLDLQDINLGCHRIETESQREQVAQGLLREIKHLSLEERSELVTHIVSQVEGLPGDLMMTDTQVQSLSKAGVAIGAHTVNHPILGSVSIDNARQEVLGSKAYLENLLQKDVDLFAYPNGFPGRDYDRQHRDLVKSLGFKAAVSTHWGVSVKQSDMYQLPRFTPWDRDQLKFQLRLLLSYRRVDSLLTDG